MTRVRKNPFQLRNKNLRSIASSYKECETDISYKEYLNINYGFMKFIFQKVLNGEQLILPMKSGQIEIVGSKVKPRLVDGRIINASPDWPATKKLRDNNPEAKKKRTVVFHFNEHTGGIRYKFKWWKLKSGMRHRSLYKFILTRTNKRTLWKKILDGKEYRIVSKNNK